MDSFFLNTQISNFMKICPVGAEMFNADGRTDGLTNRHDEAKRGCFSVVSVACCPVEISATS